MEHTVLATVSILKLLQELDGLLEDHFGTISVTNSILKKRTGNQLTFDLMMMKYKTKKSFKKKSYEELSTSCSCSKKMFYEAAEKGPD